MYVGGILKSEFVESIAKFVPNRQRNKQIGKKTGLYCIVIKFCTMFKVPSLYLIVSLKSIAKCVPNRQQESKLIKMWYKGSNE